MDDAPSCPLWGFSLAVYARPGVADACLALQARHGLDVNLLLFCCWHAAAGERPLGDRAMRHVLEAVDDWQDCIIRPLRAVRRLLKTGFPAGPAAAIAALRQRVADVELEGERIEQLLLAALLPAAAVAETDIRRCCRAAVANLAAYGRVANLRWEPGDLAPFETLLSGVFPGLDPAYRRESAAALAAGRPPRPSA